MAKRFRETTRWNRPSYRRLSFEQKGILTYLEDVCSSSGIWSGDFELLELQLGIKLTEEKLMTLLGDLVWKIGPEAFFITTFFEEQYGDAKDTFNAKRAAIAELQDLGLMDENGTLIRPSPDSHPTVPRVSPDTLSKGKSKSNKKGESEGKTNPPDELGEFLEEVYAEYPKRPNTEKSDGMKSIRIQLERSPADRPRFQAAVRGYRQYCAIRAQKPGWSSEFVKQWKTFCGSLAKPNWHEWIDWKPEKDQELRVAPASPFPPEVLTEAEPFIIAKKSFSAFSEDAAREWLGPWRWRVLTSFTNWSTYAGSGDTLKADLCKAIQSALSEAQREGA